MNFYLGTHHPEWLSRTRVPLFVSRRALERLVGSVCRRQNTIRVGIMLGELRDDGLSNLHGFGFKSQGLHMLADLATTFNKPFALASSDSLAWSYHARREARPMFPECLTHKNCANCLRFALSWREDLINSLEREGVAV